MDAPLYNPRRLGAIPHPDGVSFRVWAPHASRVAVAGDFDAGQPVPLQRVENDIWEGFVREARPGQSYQFELTNDDLHLTFRKNDAYARKIDPEKNQSVIFADDFAWKHTGFQLAPWNELIIYELHVGTFAAGPAGQPGGFDQVIRRLPYLKALGVNALELMPPMAFPSEHSWGYDLTDPFAIEPSYGGPEAFQRLVDAAHGHGIGIILDVVINHFGPAKLDLWQYDGWSENGLGGIYFYNDHRAWTPWGENRPDFGRGEVRQYLRDSCLLWLDAYRVDGLRMDATLFIRNTRGENNHPESDIAEGWTLMQWINEEVERHFPGRIRIAEDLQQNDWITKTTGAGGAGFDSQWDSGFVYSLRHCVTQTDDSGRSMEAMAQIVAGRYNGEPLQRIIYSESHDSVANGQARIPQEINPGDAAGYYARKRSTLAAAVTLTSPGIPMLFEGQEFLEDGWFRDDTVIDWSRLETYRGIHRLYHDLVQLRRNAHGHTRGLTGPCVNPCHIDDAEKVLVYHRWMDGGPGDDVMVVAGFANASREDYRIGFPRPGRWFIRFNADWTGYSRDFHGTGVEERYVDTEGEAYDGFAQSAVVPVPAYGVLILSQQMEPESPPAHLTDFSAPTSLKDCP